MSKAQREITRDDLMDMAAYEAVRNERRHEVVALKKQRRLSVGPFATFYFECYETMWYQVHEMLRTERGGEAQIPDELEAYNPLIPNGSELVATVMFEIPDQAERNRILATLGGIEDAMSIEIEGEEPVRGAPEDDAERTREDGKASSVQFVTFTFTPSQIAAFKDPAKRVTVSIQHPNYGHIAIMPDDMRAALAEDFAE